MVSAAHLARVSPGYVAMIFTWSTSETWTEGRTNHMLNTIDWIIRLIVGIALYAIAMQG